MKGHDAQHSFGLQRVRELDKDWKYDERMVLNGAILDQPNRVRAVDKSNMLETCEKIPIFCEDAVRQASKLEIPSKTKVSSKITITYKEPDHVIVAGMGGSAIGGELLKDWLLDRASIPIQVCRDYKLPAYADRNSLLIVVSYSGETEETLSAFIEGLKRQCMITTISSGGHLQAFSEKLNIPHINIPSDFPAPRTAIPYTFFPLTILMEKMRVIERAKKEIEETLDVLRRVSEENALRIPLEKNKAKTIALEIGDTIPVIYGFRQYSAVARRLKCQFNENSKVPSRLDVFSELNHNEIVGWEAPESLTKVFSLILIRDPNEPSELKRRIELTKRISSPKVHKVIEICALGNQKLARMLSAMHIGDLSSIYLAILRGVDPTPTKTIVQLKREMKKEFDFSLSFESQIDRLV